MQRTRVYPNVIEVSNLLQFYLSDFLFPADCCITHDNRRFTLCKSWFSSNMVRPRLKKALQELIPFTYISPYIHSQFMQTRRTIHEFS